MMASSLPLATTGLRCPPSSTTTSRDGHAGGTRPNGGGRNNWNEDPLKWCAWAHQGHRLWAGMPDSFWVFTYKVERCPFPADHVWTTCPYAHRGERARRRDPTRFAYAAASCPEYAESKRRLRLAGSSAAPACARGLRCGHAHNTFETWLHPTRFRTVMCQRGADCPRRICFFAHCAAQRRREGDEVPLVVFPVTQPSPTTFVPRLPASASASSSSSRSRSRPQLLASVAARQVDRVTQAVQQGRSVHLLTRRSGAVDASSSSSPTSRAVVATTTAATAPVLLLQASPSSPVDDEDIDLVALVSGCCLALEADSKAERSGYPHLDLIMDIVRS